MTLDGLSRGLRPYILLALLMAVVALPGIASVPPLDRDEARFAVASRAMAISGDWVTIRFQNEIRAKKPPGIYWLQAAMVGLTGRDGAIWVYRIPSVLGALIAVLATFGLGAPLVGRPAALLGAALLAVTPLLASEAHQAKTDAALLATAVIAQLALARFYVAARRGGFEPGSGQGTGPGWGTALAFWVAEAAAILLKGPIVPAISALTLVTLAIADRHRPHGSAWMLRLRPVPGVVLMALLAAPWAVAVQSATHGQFLAEAVRQDFLLKLIRPQESHAGPPGIYAVLAVATLWPAALFFAIGLVRAFRNRGEPVARFCLAWSVPAWVMFELVPTKLPHYILPLVPAFALLAGEAAAAAAGPLRSRGLRLYAVLAIPIGLLFAAFALAAPPYLGGRFALASVPCALAAAAAAVAPPLLALRGRLRLAAGAALAAGIGWGFLFGGVLPALDSLWLSQRVAEDVPAGAPAVAAGYREPSLVFLLGAGTRFSDGSGAADFLIGTPGAVAVVEAREEASFHDRMAKAGRAPRELAEVDGMNYVHGKPARIVVWTMDQPKETKKGST